MSDDIFHKALDRINTDDVFRTVVAGYGEPTTHAQFMQYVTAIGEHPGRFDMVTNGQLLDEARFKHLDGRVDLLIISFSSIDPDVYSRVHVNLTHERVKENIKLAQKIFNNTQVAISLTPLVECIETLPDTIQWLRKQGIELLTMSPTLYNRAGAMNDHRQSTEKLRWIIKYHKLHSQELDFIPSITDAMKQMWKNSFRCAPRNSDLFISSGGDYLYCYNDIAHRHILSHVDVMSIRQVLAKREQMPPVPDLCRQCNMLDRYGFREIVDVIKTLVRTRVKTGG
jgi:MoaA/NifB/PqqE/SkfB family radical SAM enzyme